MSGNITLIGMPGAGKSTVGVLLAKKLCKQFLDVDVYIQALECRLLKEIIDDEGISGFIDREEKHVLSIDVKETVISTGGSVVYSESAMTHIRQMGRVVFLDVPLELIYQRLGDLNLRCVVIEEGMSIADLYEERLSLYHKYADVTIDCGSENQNTVVQKVLNQLSVKNS